TACLDSGSGEEIWRREDLPCRHYRGPGSSPLLHGDLLVLTMDGVDQQYLVALDKHSGETVWKTDRSAEWDDWGPDGLPFNEGDLRKAYSTPIVAATSTGEQLISVGAKAAYAYDPATGDELWKVAHGGQGVAPRPLYHDDIAFLCTGFGATEMLAIRTDARGLVGESHIAWRSIRGVPQLPSPILHDGAIYLLGDRGVLTCISEATGEEVWRLRVPGEYVSSPVLAGGRIYCCNTEGVTAVVDLGDLEAAGEPTIVAENKLDAGFMASPAVVDGDLILRTKTHLYRIHAEPAASP
ncbi:MAG: PQQ-binding-like beta-propeller repeat protein, partial [Planctomycetales bacterium]|nr:PQQ-binding-like beta-propeller repeat protein [Planctomycetales bacterium]